MVKMNCLFESLITVSHSTLSPTSLRRKLIKHVRDNADSYKEHVKIEGGGETIAQYCRRMRNENEMGDYTMIVAFCRLFKYSVRIVFKESRGSHTVEVFPNAPLVSISYAHDHYEPLSNSIRVLSRPIHPPQRFKPCT